MGEAADRFHLFSFVGGWIELVGGLLVAIGLFTGWASFICSGEMAVAYFMVHAAKGGPISDRE